jgi:phage-related tail protein
MTPEYWIGLGTALLLIGTAMVTWGTVNSMKIISDSTTVIKSATENLQTQTQKIEGINNAIATKAGKITDLASESLNQLTSAEPYAAASGEIKIL